MSDEEDLQLPTVCVEPLPSARIVGRCANILDLQFYKQQHVQGTIWGMPPALQQGQTHRHTSNQKNATIASPRPHQRVAAPQNSPPNRRWPSIGSHTRRTSQHYTQARFRSKPALCSAARLGTAPAVAAAHAHMSCARAPAAHTAAPTARCTPRALPHRAHRPARLLYALDLVLHLHVQLLEPVELVIVRVPVATAARL